MSKTIVLTLVTMLAVPASDAPIAHAGPQGTVTVRATESLEKHLTNGGMSGKGHFTISGAISDKGPVTDYRTQKANIAVVRRVAVGAKGTITFLITINVNTASETWTIASGTKAYKGLHGKGKQVLDAWYSSPARFVMTGTVSQ